MRMSCSAYIMMVANGDGAPAHPLYTQQSHAMQQCSKLTYDDGVCVCECARCECVCISMSPEIRDMDNKDIQMIPVIIYVDVFLSTPHRAHSQSCLLCAGMFLYSNIN